MTRRARSSACAARAGCVRSPLNNCPMRPACHGYDAQVVQLQKYIKEGKSEDDILSAFVKEYGAAVLADPERWIQLCLLGAPIWARSPGPADDRA